MRPIFRMAGLLVLAGCVAAPGGGVSESGQRAAALISDTSALARPPGAPPGSCWQRDVAPAVVETVVEQRIVTPPRTRADGSTQPAVIRTETRQRIVRDRSAVWFETPCPPEMTPALIASLQRALLARGFYSGQATGMMDAATRAALRSYQAQNGLDSDILSIRSARELGLVDYPFRRAAR